MSTKDLHLEELDKSVVDGIGVSNFEAISSPHEIVKHPKIFQEKETLSDLMSSLESVSSELYNKIYIGDKLLATLIPAEEDSRNKYQLDGNNADYFLTKYSAKMNISTFRLEKTDAADGEYSLFLRVGLSQEREVMIDEDEQFKANNTNDLINKMQLVISGKDDFNTVFRYDSGVKIKVVTLQIDNEKKPLFIMQGNRVIDNKFGAEFSSDFTTNLSYMISKSIPDYTSSKIVVSNQENVEKAIDNLLSETKESDFDNVIALLNRKKKDLVKSNIEKNKQKNN
jgi:hypothetical protein